MAQPERPIKAMPLMLSPAYGELIGPFARSQQARRIAAKAHQERRLAGRLTPD
jgi:hypothetical protein